MEKRTDNALADEILRAAKRKHQEESRELACSGARTQESMLFTPPDLLRAPNFGRRTGGF